VHDTRVIPLDGRPHLSQKIRQYMGDSRGRWEGNTLVVETTNLTDQTSIGLNGNGLRHSADMKIVERFTRMASDELQYEISIDDPKTYTRPFKISVPLISPEGFKLLPYDCHEGNYMMLNSLKGAREREKAGATWFGRMRLPLGSRPCWLPDCHQQDRAHRWHWCNCHR